MAFKDRQEAGQQLAEKIVKERFQDPIVFGIARGGVVVAAEVARTLSLPLDVILVRKLGLPGQPELGFGAIAPNDILYINERLVASTNLSANTIAAISDLEEAELKRRQKVYRQDKPWPKLENRDAILVDDGIATGVSVQAAIEFLKTLSPRSITLAAPVCATDTAAELKLLVQKTIFLETPAEFYAVGQFYQNFPQTTDEEVIELLKGYNNNIK